MFFTRPPWGSTRTLDRLGAPYGGVRQGNVGFNWRVCEEKEMGRKLGTEASTLLAVAGEPYWFPNTLGQQRGQALGSNRTLGIYTSTQASRLNPTDPNWSKPEP